MGDRARCTLALSGELTKADHDKLLARLRALNPEEESGSWEDESGSWFNFGEVNYADMANLDPALECDLIALGVSFAWSWDAGFEYGPGVRLFIPRLGPTPLVFSALDEEIALPVLRVKYNPAALKTAIEYGEAWCEVLNGGLAVMCTPEPAIGGGVGSAIEIMSEGD